MKTMIKCDMTHFVTSQSVSCHTLSSFSNICTPFNFIFFTAFPDNKSVTNSFFENAETVRPALAESLRVFMLIVSMIRYK